MHNICFFDRLLLYPVSGPMIDLPLKLNVTYIISLAKYVSFHKIHSHKIPYRTGLYVTLRNSLLF